VSVVHGSKTTMIEKGDFKRQDYFRFRGCKQGSSNW
jgi:hypothetical protein